MFIAVEGPDGAGKSTLCRAIVERLREGGREVVEVREPGGTQAAERIREVVLDAGTVASARSELFMYLAARADLVERVIRPALESGKFVVSDRFEMSTFAYQGHGRGLGEGPVRAANQVATGGLSPDLTIVLDVDIETGASRRDADGRAPDRIESEPQELHRLVAEFFREAQGPGIVHVDGTRPADEVADTAWQLISTELEGKK